MMRALTRTKSRSIPNSLIVFFWILLQRHGVTGGSIPKCTAFLPSTTARNRNRKHLYSQQQSTTPTQITQNQEDISITLPRFFPGEIAEGTYPSPLHTIHIRTILTNHEVAQCLQLATEYAKRTKCWDQPDVQRHATYSTCDFAVEDNDELQAYLMSIDFDNRLWSTLEELYGISQQDMEYLDFFCAHYQANNNNNNNNNDDDNDNDNSKKRTMDRLEPHRDGSLLSFTILLNNPSEFTGGGTFFDALRDVNVNDVDSSASSVLHPGGVIRPLRAGDACFHCGKLFHGADVVTTGCRTVLVGFVNVAEWVQRPGSLSQACRDWGRMDVALKRYQRQLAKTCPGENGWVGKIDRWTFEDRNEDQGRSCVRGFVPAFESVKRRADPEYQRQQKLQAEDRLLRSILLRQDEAGNHLPAALWGGDITVL